MSIPVHTDHKFTFESKKTNFIEISYVPFYNFPKFMSILFLKLKELKNYNIWKIMRENNKNTWQIIQEEEWEKLKLSFTPSSVTRMLWNHTVLPLHQFGYSKQKEEVSKLRTETYLEISQGTEGEERRFTAVGWE